MSVREKRISPKVSAKVGFEDARVEIGIKVPIIGNVNVTIRAEELDDAAEVVREALKHREAILAKLQGKRP